MKSNYKPLGKYIQPVVGRNNDLGDLPLMGLSIQKKFIPSIANTIGTDMSTYRTIYKNQFAFGPVTSRNGDKITIALFNDYDKALISQAYIPFEVKDNNELDAEYLMMWFRRPEFDRYARFKSHGSAREIFDWEEMCNTLLPIPSINKQREIVKEYNVIQNRIAVNQQLIQKLEETAQSIYKQWFVEFEFPDETGKPYKSNGGEMVFNEDLQREIPMGWEVKALRELISVIDNRGKTPPCVEHKTHFPLIEIGAIRNNSRVIDIDKCEKYVSEKTYKNWFRSGHPQKKDILFSTVGSLAEMKLFWKQTGAIAQNIVAFRCVNDIGLYLYQYLINNRSDLVAYEIGSVQASIKVSQVIDFKIVLPNEIVTTNFDKIICKLTNHLNIIYIENQKLTEMKDLLLSKLTTIK
jgi:type I restriction enzyme S subunit